jgi:leucyl-tRNA synthetase
VLRKAHWAIDKVSRDLGGGRFAFNTAIAAVMELLNELDPRSAAALGRRGALRAATAASLIFPFAPARRRRRLRAADRRRVWEEPWPEPPTAFLTATRSSSSSRSTASRAPASRRRPGRRGRAAHAGPRAPERPGARRRQAIVKEIVVPGKLVNLVVR